MPRLAAATCFLLLRSGHRRAVTGGRSKLVPRLAQALSLPHRTLQQQHAAMFEARIAQGNLLKKASAGGGQQRGASSRSVGRGGLGRRRHPVIAAWRAPSRRRGALPVRCSNAQARPPSTAPQVVEAIKDLIEDANFDCNNSGFSLQAMDSSHVSLVGPLAGAPTASSTTAATATSAWVRWGHGAAAGGRR